MKKAKIVAALNELKQELTTEELQSSIEQLMRRYDSSIEDVRFSFFGLLITDVSFQGLITVKPTTQDDLSALSLPPTIPKWLKIYKKLIAVIAIPLWLGGVFCYIAYCNDYNTTENPSKDYVG